MGKLVEMFCCSTADRLGPDQLRGNRFDGSPLLGIEQMVFGLGKQSFLEPFDLLFAIVSALKHPAYKP
jgi:hypothetical protein